MQAQTVPFTKVVAHSVCKAEASNRENRQHCRIIDAAENHSSSTRPIVSKPKTGGRNMISEHPNQNTQEKQKNRVQRLAEAEKLHVIHYRQRKNGTESSKNFSCLKLGEFIADKTQNVANKLNGKCLAQH